MDIWHDVGHTSNLSFSWDKRGIREKRAHFLVLDHEREEKKERRELRLPPTINGVPLVGFHRAKNESSSHRQGVRMSTRKEGFHQSSKRGDFGNSSLSSLRGFLPMYHAPKGKGFFLPSLTFHFWAEKR